ncbi:hypothetical protein BV898_08308, partial [Hypsibius exemplaris]
TAQGRLRRFLGCGTRSVEDCVKEGFVIWMIYTY